MFLLYALIFVILVTGVLFLSQRLVWSFIKKDRVDAAQKLHALNRGVHEAAAGGIRTAKKTFADSLAASPSPTFLGLFSVFLLSGLDTAMQETDHSSVIRRKIRKEVTDLLELIETLKRGAKHPAVTDFLEGLEQDVLTHRDSFENLEDIQDIRTTLEFISGIRNDAEATAELSDDDVDVAPETDTRNYYEIFGIPRDASSDAIKKAYRTLAQKHHPDKNPGDTGETFQRINTIYQTLKDPVKRKEYDDCLS